MHIPNQVANIDNGEIYSVVSLTLKHPVLGSTITIPPKDMNENFSEYVDPKDVEIQRLTKELNELRATRVHKEPRKGRTNLTDDQKYEAELLYSTGATDAHVMSKFDVSLSTARRMREVWKARLQGLTARSEA